MKHSRHLVRVLSLAVLGVAMGCGDEIGGPPPGTGGNSGPFKILEVFLRPFVIENAADAGTSPTPQMAAYNLTAFFEGGAVQKPVFTWNLNAALGELRPKVDGLGINESSVVLLYDGSAAKGFYDIDVTGVSGQTTRQLSARFAVVENSWVKHQRTRNVDLAEPASDLVKHPTWQILGTETRLVYSEAPFAIGIDLKSISAEVRLMDSEQLPRTVFLPPASPPRNTVSAADEWPSFSPPALGRDEMLFSSQMDLDFTSRCPNPVTCTKRIPRRIWVARSPSASIAFRARPFTRDSSFVRNASTDWVANDFLEARWDPTATSANAAAPIAFRSDRRGGATDTNRSMDLWLANLVDLNGDARSDTLMNYRQLTVNEKVTNYAWHPNGEKLYFTSSGAMSTVTVQPPHSIERISFSDKDTELKGITGISVFVDPGSQETLIAFQGESEARTNLYVYNEDADKLTRALPFSFDPSHRLWPSWHPTKKWIAYVGDYSVGAWSDEPDQPPEGKSVRFGFLRTAHPSVWVVKFED